MKRINKTSEHWCYIRQNKTCSRNSINQGQHLPVGLGVSFIIVSLTCGWPNVYLSRNENMDDGCLVFEWPLCRLLTDLLMVLRYSLTPKLVCGNIKLIVRGVFETFLLSWVNSCWPNLPPWLSRDFTPPLIKTTSAPIIKRAYKPRIFFLSLWSRSHG